MNEHVEVLIGRHFGNYRLVRTLGRGGFASVYLGENIYINTLVAVKVLHTEIEQSDMERFRIEARTIATLKHPHIVQLIDFGLEQKVPYLVMSYAPHGHLRQLQATVGAFALPTVVSYVKQIASALQFAHDHKVIHRDIKPENILLDAQDALLLSDFGIALIAQTSHQQSVKDITGTLAYMAPEQTQGKPAPASDQYALGVMAYELLTGTRLFQGSFTEIIAQHFSAPPPSLREKLPTLPIAVEQVIWRSLAKSPQERFPSVSAFAQALEEASKLQETQQDVSTHFYQAPLSVPLSAQMHSQTTPSSFTTGNTQLPTSLLSTVQTGILPASPNFLRGKRSYRLLSIMLICAVLITFSGIFLVHLRSTQAVQTGFIPTHNNKPSATVPPVSSQQSPPTRAKSTPTIEKNATMIARDASTPVVIGNIISTATIATTEKETPTPILTTAPTALPIVIPTPTTQPVAMPTPIPSPTPTSSAGGCGSFTGYYKIVNKNSGLNLDVLNDALTDSALIIQYTDNGKTDQQWSFVATSAGYCKIINHNSGNLLNIPGPTTTAATQLIQFHDDGGLNSQWELVALGNNAYKIISRYDSQCIDVSQSSVSNSAAVVQFPDNGGLNQQWQLVQV